MRVALLESGGVQREIARDRAQSQGEKEPDPCGAQPRIRSRKDVRAWSQGTRARSGGTKGRSFEGGQRPLQQRLPKRSFSNYPFSKEFALVNVGQLAGFEPGTVVTPGLLVEMKLIKNLKSGVKVLGDSEIDSALTVKAHAFSKSAAEKIAAAGGATEVI